jgi:hypothetical protein
MVDTDKCQLNSTLFHRHEAPINDIVFNGQRDIGSQPANYWHGFLTYCPWYRSNADAALLEVVLEIANAKSVQLRIKTLATDA